MIKPYKATCDVCNKKTYPTRLCSCPERREDGSWEEKNIRGDILCADCGTKDNPVWYTDNVFWNAVMGEHLVHNQKMGNEGGKILCINCFTIRAEKKYKSSWRLIPDWKWQERHQNKKKICEQNCPDYNGMAILHSKQCSCSCHKAKCVSCGETENIKITVEEQIAYNGVGGRCFKCVKEDNNTCSVSLETDNWEKEWLGLRSTVCVTKDSNNEYVVVDVAASTKRDIDFIRQQIEKTHQETISSIIELLKDMKRVLNPNKFVSADIIIHITSYNQALDDIINDIKNK